jgi:hypothetical protein
VNVTRPKTSSSLERVAFSVPEFCFRNNISRQKYRGLRAEKRGPAEMRVDMNTVRITIEAERAWQLLMQAPRPDIESKATERAIKAGDASAKSARHVSKNGRKGAIERQKASQQQTNSQLTTKTTADQQKTIRELSAQLRKARQKRREQSRPDNVGTDST